MPTDYAALVARHLARVIDTGQAVGYGPDDTAMWMSSLDTRTGRYPADDARPAHIPKRVYRNIDAPRGVSLYWDQPSIVAAHALSGLTGDTTFAGTADAYVRDFLARCVAPTTGLLLWGNHYYWDAFRGCVVRFSGEEPPVPVDPASETGVGHEARPLPVAWESFWRLDPAVTDRAIRAMGAHHVFDAQSGGFNRHADRRREYAFIEAGGILAEALAWLTARTGDRGPAELAARIARYSWANRDEATDLVRNSPDMERWDRYACTTEVGLWAGCLLRMGEAELDAIARRAVLAWVSRGFDEATGLYWGRLNVSDGQPNTDPTTTPYMPDRYSDPWRPLFPAHDYPMAMAQTCVELLAQPGLTPTDEAELERAVRRWAGVLDKTWPAPDQPAVYAEHLGRAVHFLASAGDALNEPALADAAHARADWAITALRTDGMFRGHTGEDRYDAVDGVGWLLLALLRLHAGAAAVPDMGLHF